MRICLNRKSKKLLIFVIVMDVIFATIKVLSSFEWFSEHLFARVISRGISLVLQKLNALFPFSIIETMVVTIILAIIAVIALLIFARGKLDNSPVVDKILTDVFVVIVCFVTLYMLIGTSLYNRAEIYEPLSLEKVKVNDDLVYEALDHYLDELIAVEAQVNRDENGNVLLPYDFDKLNDMLNVEFERLTDPYFTQNKVRLKKIRLSFFMTFTFITGVYVAFLGESSINTNVPAYTLPVTMAHEMAHGKGCVRENDANCIAYYICVTSDDPYLKYCGLMDVCSTLYSKLSKEKRSAIIDRFPTNCLLEYKNHDEFFDQYQGVVEKVSEFINDIHLKGSGVKEGTISYLMTDVFICSMYKGLYAEDQE